MKLVEFQREERVVYINPDQVTHLTQDNQNFPKQTVVHFSGVFERVPYPIKVVYEMLTKGK